MRNSLAILTLLSGFLLAQPSFTAADIISNLAGASAVSAADMDNDGDIDIVAADEVLDSSNSLVIQQSQNRIYSAHAVLKQLLENG